MVVTFQALLVSLTSDTIKVIQSPTVSGDYSGPQNLGIKLLVSLSSHEINFL